MQEGGGPVFIAAAAAAAAAGGGRRGRGTGGRGWRWELFVCPARAAAAWEIARVLDRRACMAVVVACGVCTDGRRAPGTQPRPKGGKKNWLSSEEPGKETKAQEKKGKKNDSRPLPMSLRGCLAEYEGGSGRLAGLGMGWDARSASRTASSSRNVNSTAGPDSVNYDALWPWKERGARALVRWDVLDASLFLSLSLRARLGRPPRAKMSWNSDQA